MGILVAATVLLHLIMHVACDGYLSCSYAILTASGSGSSSCWLWSRGGFAALYATVSGFEDVKCFGEGSCYVNNID